MALVSIRAIVCALGFALLLGCSDKAKELFETAAFEENQGNIPHAKELYEELVRSYPSSKEAELARAHLADLK
jgi:TolA-binding protein